MPVPPVIQMYRYVMGSGGGVSNLLLGSEELGSTGVGRWNQNLMNAVNSDQVNNPEGTEQTADQLDFQASKTARITQDVTLVAGTEYTFSVWARAASGTQDFRLSYWDNVGRNFGTSAHTASATWSPTTGRYSFTFTAATSGTFSMYIQNATDAVSRRIYFWGAMLNVGATAADYIKTEFIGPSSPATPLMEFGDNFAGVTAYYSLRRFTRGADNNAIRVRRSSDDTEQDIGFDANGDLDTTALLAFVNADVEKIVNGDFATDSNWTKGTGWTISGGTANCDGTQTGSSEFKTAVGIAIQGVEVTFSFEVKNYSAGTLNATIEGTGTLEFSGINANGVYSTTATSSDALPRVTFTASSDFVGSIDDVSVIQSTADGAVTTFYDQTGNGNDATNSTESEQPLVVSGGSVLVDGNGKAKIQATASTQYLTATRIDPNPLYSFYALEKGTSTGAFSGFTGQWTDSYAIFFGSTRASVFDTSGTRHNVARGTTMTSGNRYLISAVFDNDIEIYQDGTLEGSVSGVGDLRFSNISQELRFFSYSANNSDPDSCLQEIIIFNSDQSANRTGMETNINDHFDIYT